MADHLAGEAGAAQKIKEKANLSIHQPDLERQRSHSSLFSGVAQWFQGFVEQQSTPRNVPAILASLPGKPMVVNDVAARYGKIDHLVIRGDGAVFLIETYAQSGRITEDKGDLRHDGQPFETDFIRQTTR